MIHRGVTYVITPTTEPNIWKWEFQVAGVVRTGRTEARLELLAVRRVRQHIDRELRRIADGTGE